ncbi:MAG: SprT family zinc-dependent metalloprotease [Candidatus Nanopelagicales bacterium]|nr:SprT family zinc-dependent metalloprotease [Candidatus Nanopelagicales bacterium]
MSTASTELSVRGIDVSVAYKDVKNLNISVYPPLGRVRVSAPRHVGEDVVRLAVVQRLGWIKKQQDRIRSADRQSPRGLITGESHYVWGVRLRLEVVERPGRAQVETDADRLILYVPPGMGADGRETVLQNWQRQQLRAAIPPLLAEWEPIVGRSVNQWGIRRMKTRWGSCNPTAARIWLSLELARRHPHCLEYVAVHELTHLLERGHGERFKRLMDGFLPDWRARRRQLNAAPLADENW